MDSDLSIWSHLIHAQVAVAELERKLGIRTNTTDEDSELLDFTFEPGEPPD
jgi:hypothetical protein